MLGGAVGRRYAQALYEIATEQKALDAIEADLKSVLMIIESEQDIQKILDHPQISATAKHEVLKALFAERISETVQNFLCLLIDNQREAYLGEVVAEFINMVNIARDVVEAEVISAQELTATRKTELAKVLKSLVGKKVTTEYLIDATLLGGVVMRVGDKVIDGSVKNRLNTLKQHLVSKIG
ncbi:MAG: F0F1 ATP synthase subunit delta [Desulfotomaculum sp.]|nr:F0F1 ATP synthase subunit delta [Desulfotomaculum sp.]